VHADSRGIAARRLAHVRDTGPPNPAEIGIVAADGAIVQVESASAWVTWHDKPAIIAVLRDITRRKRAENALRESKALLEKIFDNTYTLIAYMDRDFNFIKVNRAYAEADGRTPEFFPGRNHFDLYPHEENEQIFREVVRTGETYVAYEKPFTYPDRPDLVTYWDWRLQPLKDESGNVESVVLCLLDVTERKHVQQELRSLVCQLSRAEESERRRMAMSLHDYVGQSLSLSQIMLGSLRENARDEDFAGQVDDVRALIATSIEDTRDLIFELSPPLLYEVGLEAALEQLAEQTAVRHEIEVVFEGRGRGGELEQALRIALFQAARELLINAVKHAQASRIVVRTATADEMLEISVTDDGVGFDSGEAAFRVHEDGGFGLFNIRERMDGLGGSFKITSAPCGGTRAVLLAPIASLKGDG
jgi:PAS domain S-box-containing protein